MSDERDPKAAAQQRDSEDSLKSDSASAESDPEKSDPEQSASTDSVTVPSSSIEEARSADPKFKSPGKGFQTAWLRTLPFVMSAGLFLSGLFSMFAPAPLLLIGMNRGLKWALLAGVTNSGLVFLLGGPALFQFYLIGIVLMAILIPILLKERRMRLEATLGWTWGLQVAALGALVTVYAALRGHQPWDEVRITLGGFFDQMIQTLSPESKEQLLGDLTADEWKARSAIEWPMNLLTVSVLMIFVNLNLLITLMGRNLRSQLGLDRKSFHRWRNAEWLIWPTIIVWSGYLATLYFNLGDPLGAISLGLFKFILVLYGIQGLAILGSLFDAWRVQGVFRLGLYFFALFLVLPLVVSIGFFDQWFDFRARIRQS